jgi:hypothetical protein
MTSKDDGSAALLDGLVASGRLHPDDAELLRHELGEAERRGAARSGAVLSWVTAAIAALFCGLQIPWLLTVPKFRLMFEEMNLGSLPKETEMLMVLPTWVYVASCFLLVIAILVKEALIRNKVITMILNGVAIGAVLVSTAFMKWALFSPMVSMMQKLGQEGGGSGM